MRKVPYPTPGEILAEEFLGPMGISPYRLAKDIGVPQIRISEILAGKRAVTVDTGLRLSRYFGMNAVVIARPPLPACAERHARTNRCTVRYEPS